MPVESARTLFLSVNDLEKDRLILDARGPNIQIPWFSCVCLPGHAFSVREPPRVWPDDYYNFVISEGRVVRNCLPEIVRAEVASDLLGGNTYQDERGLLLRPALGSLAMGDINSVEFGQLAHPSLPFFRSYTTGQTHRELRSAVA